MPTATDHQSTDAHTDAHTAAIHQANPSTESNSASNTSASNTSASNTSASNTPQSLDFAVTKSVAPSTGESARPELALPPQATAEIVVVLKLFADETRVKILAELLQAGEANVQTLCRTLGQTQPAVSHHLALLKEAKMVEMRRSGKHNFYRVSDSPRERVLQAMAPLFEIAKQESSDDE